MGTRVGKERGVWGLAAAIVGMALLAAAASSMGLFSGAGAKAGEPIIGELPGGYSSQIRQPTAEECRGLAQIVPPLREAIAKGLEERVTDAQLRTAMIVELDAAAARGEAWVAAGCPEDKELGVYHALDGSGYAIRVILWPPSDSVGGFTSMGSFSLPEDDAGE